MNEHVKKITDLINDMVRDQSIKRDQLIEALESVIDNISTTVEALMSDAEREARAQE